MLSLKSHLNECPKEKTQVIRFVPLMFMAVLAACDESMMSDLESAISGEPQIPEVPQLPANVVAALPPGVPSTVVFVDSNNCYAVGIEVTEPQQGYPLRGPDGQQICVAGFEPAIAADPAPAVPAA